ncbi:hypothetical protein EAO79_08610 [Plantibacter sp. PA-3-X8]|nr:hypothetical protein EAO79_08610 [Plantibacter sp. PA-3-X8]
MAGLGESGVPEHRTVGAERERRHRERGETQAVVVVDADDRLVGIGAHGRRGAQRAQPRLPGRGRRTVQRPDGRRDVEEGRPPPVDPWDVEVVGALVRHEVETGFDVDGPG